MDYNVQIRAGGGRRRVRLAQQPRVGATRGHHQPRLQQGRRVAPPRRDPSIDGDTMEEVAERNRSGDFTSQTGVGPVPVRGEITRTVRRDRVGERHRLQHPNDDPTVRGQAPSRHTVRGREGVRLDRPRIEPQGRSVRDMRHCGRTGGKERSDGANKGEESNHPERWATTFREA